MAIVVAVCCFYRLLSHRISFSICLKCLSWFVASFHNEYVDESDELFHCLSLSFIHNFCSLGWLCAKFSSFGCFLFWPFLAITLHPRIMIDLKQQGVVLIVCFLILLVFSDIFASLSSLYAPVYISRSFYSLTFLTFFSCPNARSILVMLIRSSMLFLCSPHLFVSFCIWYLFSFRSW